MLDRKSDILNKYQNICDDYAWLHQKAKSRKHDRQYLIQWEKKNNYYND